MSANLVIDLEVLVNDNQGDKKKPSKIYYESVAKIDSFSCGILRDQFEDIFGNYSGNPIDATLVPGKMFEKEAAGNVKYVGIGDIQWMVQNQYDKVFSAKKACDIINKKVLYCEGNREELFDAKNTADEEFKEAKQILEELIAIERIFDHERTKLSYAKLEDGKYNNIYNDKSWRLLIYMQY